MQCQVGLEKSESLGEISRFRASHACYFEAAALTGPAGFPPETLQLAQTGTPGSAGESDFASLMAPNQAIDSHAHLHIRLRTRLPERSTTSSLKHTSWVPECLELTA